jgi:hypothetical protein
LRLRRLLGRTAGLLGGLLLGSGLGRGFLRLALGTLLFLPALALLLLAAAALFLLDAGPAVTGQVLSPNAGATI